MRSRGRQPFLRLLLLRLAQVIVLCSVAFLPALAQQPNQALKERIGAFDKPAGRTVAGQDIAGADFIKKLYVSRGYVPAWTNPANVEALRSAVEQSPDDGLSPSDFHAAAFGSLETLSAVEREIILSDAFLRLLYQLYYGKLSPNAYEATWNFDRPIVDKDVVSLFNAAFESGSVGTLIADVRLKRPFYLGLKNVLSRYREIARKGGWNSVPEGPALKPGAKDPRILALRQRLAASGEHKGKPEGDADVFDAALVADLRKFQATHGIEADGVLGAGTVAALNVPVAARVDQIRANLERARWVLRSALKDDMIIVNIAGFNLRLIFGNKVAWTTRVIVGKSYTQTPVFTERLKQVVFNPDWTVPTSIARNEIAPKARADPGYLQQHHYDLKNGSGQIVDPGIVDWTTVSSSNFPYTVVQRPGPDNALGLVKFLFPNRYNVYLHDTPNRTLFSKTSRTFSHGCIRVENPLKLAELILAKKKGWTRAQVDAAVASQALTPVPLSGDISVLLLYWTVDPTGEEAVFHNDPYGRDPKLIAGLNQPFKVK